MFPWIFLEVSKFCHQYYCRFIKVMCQRHQCEVTTSLLLHFMSSYSVHTNIPAEVSANGGVGRAEHTSDNIWQEKQDTCLLPLLAQVQDLEK